MKFLTPEVLNRIFLFSVVLFFIFSTSLSLVLYQLFPQHIQQLYFINGCSHIPYMCCNINTLMVKTYGPVMNEMDNIIRLTLKQHMRFGFWIYHQLLIERGKERPCSGRLTRKRQPKSLDERQYPQL